MVATSRNCGPAISVMPALDQRAGGGERLDHREDQRSVAGVLGDLALAGLPSLRSSIRLGTTIDIIWMMIDAEI